MIADYNDKREALAELQAKFRRAHNCAAPGSDLRSDFARWLDLLTGIDEDLMRAHLYSHVAIEYEAPRPIRNKGGRPKNAVQHGAMA